MAAFVTATINGSAGEARRSADGLRRLGVAQWALDALVRAPDWPAGDDDRFDVISMFAAHLTRVPRSVTEHDVGRLRSVGLTDADIVELVRIVSYYNYANRVTAGLGLDIEI